MAATLIDGKMIASQIRQQLKSEIDSFRSEHGVQPGLAVVLVGDDPASHVYVRGKEKACAEVGIRSERHELPAQASADEILDLIRRLAADDQVHGILVQLPLPDGIDPNPIIAAVPPEKDVDGFHPQNMGHLLTGSEGLVPCTPAGIMELIRQTGIDPAGKRAVVIGRSNIVGKPIALLLLAANATVTICHSRTEDLAEEVRRADIVVAAVGSPELIKGSWIKPGAVVIDVGINRTSEGKLVGDVEFASASEKAGYITPVPGGVGPMTIAMLLKNTLQAAKNQLGVFG